MEAGSLKTEEKGFVAAAATAAWDVEIAS